jgi:hypothetical protein
MPNLKQSASSIAFPQGSILIEMQLSPYSGNRSRKRDFADIGNTGISLLNGSNLTVYMYGFAD